MEKRKSLKISSINLKELDEIKEKRNFKSIDETIGYLIIKEIKNEH
jgi:hypothetical protein